MCPHRVGAAINAFEEGEGGKGSGSVGHLGSVLCDGEERSDTKVDCKSGGRGGTVGRRRDQISTSLCLCTSCLLRQSAACFWPTLIHCNLGFCLRCSSALCTLDNAVLRPVLKTDNHPPRTPRHCLHNAAKARAHRRPVLRNSHGKCRQPEEKKRPIGHGQ